MVEASALHIDIDSAIKRQSEDTRDWRYQWECHGWCTCTTNPSLKPLNSNGLTARVAGPSSRPAHLTLW
jgi:hypothetical protein